MFGHHETFSDIINLEGNHMHSELKGRTWKSECEKCVLAMFFELQKKELSSAKDPPADMQKHKDLRAQRNLRSSALGKNKTKQNSELLETQKTLSNQGLVNSELDNATQSKDQIKDVPF